MLQILTDEQIDPDVALAARRRYTGITAISLFDWLDGHFLGSPSEEVLREAARHGMTLLSVDLMTLPPLIRAWSERGIDHGGVIFIDTNHFAMNDIAGISKALVELWELEGNLDWKNRCFLLRPR